ncbi:MAG TPA: hypothetical protein VGA69_00685 [Nitriliruptorales bacterium]
MRTRLTIGRPHLPDAKLVRVQAVDGSWIDELPPVPLDETVTVTVGAAPLAAVPADDLVSRGYRIAGIVQVAGQPDGAAYVDLLVPDALAQAHPGWWRTLVELSERTFALAHGPVRLLFADELTLHARALGTEHRG